MRAQRKKTKSGHNGHNGQRKADNNVATKQKKTADSRKVADGLTKPTKLTTDPELTDDQRMEAAEAIASQWVWDWGKEPSPMRRAVKKAVYAAQLKAIHLPNGNSLLDDALKVFQDEQEPALKLTAGQKAEAAEQILRLTNPEVGVKATKLLHAPSILEEMVTATNAMGHVSEEPLRSLVFLSAVAGLTARTHKDAVHVIVKGKSAGGKSDVLNRVLSLFPPSTALFLTNATEASFAYADAVPVLVFQEVHGQKTADYIVRQIQSEGKVVRQLVNRDLCTVYKTSVITTTVLESIRDENETRAFSIHVSKDPELTHQIMLAAERMDTGELPPTLDETLLLVWHEALSQLKPSAVVLTPEIASTLTEMFPIELERSRRDRPRAVNLVKACALLHQFQRKSDSQGRLEATDADYEMVIPILMATDGTLEPLNSVQGDAVLVLLTEMCAKSPLNGQVRQATLVRESVRSGGPADRTVRRWLKRLEESGVAKSSGKGGFKFWQLTSYKATP